MIFQLLFSAAILLMGAELIKRGTLKYTHNKPRLTVVVVPLSLISGALMVALQAGTGASPNIALGGVISASLFSLFAISGFAALLRPVDTKSVTPPEKGTSLIAAVLLWLTGSDGIITRTEGVALLIVYLAYATMANPVCLRVSDKESSLEPKCTRWGAAAYGFMGVALLITGGNLLIDGTVSAALAQDSSEAATSILLLGTFTTAALWLAAIQAARSGQGSALALTLRAQPAILLAATGASAALCPIPMDVMLQQKALPMLAFAHGVALFIFWRTSALTRSVGALLLALWAGCVITLSV